MRVIGPLALLRTLALFAAVAFLAGCNVDLYTRLSENEANEMVALLIRNGISASRMVAKDGSSIVRVEEGSFADAVSILDTAGLPRQKFATFGDVFADNKLVSSPTEERARFIYALSQELSKTLSEIDGVLVARVHLVLPKNDPLREDQQPSSASVFIKHDPGASVVALLPQIKTLVTNSIEGLTYDKVSVVFVPGQKQRSIVADKGSQHTAESAQALFAGIPPSVLIMGAAAGWLLALVCLFPQALRRFRQVFEAERTRRASSSN